ncbi:MAG: cation transporter [Candidatus Delongbacteria bacterium]
MKTLDLDIKGMHCASCSSLINITLENLKGVKNPAVNLLTNSASMQIDESAISPETIVKKIEQLGYKAFIAEGGEKKKP